MKESMNCALTISWNILPGSIRKEINEDKDCYGGIGLHIHCPDTSTPKDGPSAGVAITLAIISRLCKIPILNTIAVTGEIDLLGFVHQIGGVEAKVTGAIRAGVTKIMLPEDNRFDYEKYIQKKKEEKEDLLGRDKDLSSSDEYIDDNIEVVFIKTIHDAIEHAFIENDLDFSKLI
tara:strand:- start:9 stop:536 length:528 start_codon:yes stop_codon:yes gene_type:complete